jgi:hypothetical protein
MLCWYARRELSVSILELWAHGLESVAGTAPAYNRVSAASQHPTREYKEPTLRFLEISLTIWEGSNCVRGPKGCTR